MEHICPTCKNAIVFDVSSLRNVLLRFECPSCTKKLIISSDSKTLLDAEDRDKKERLSDLVFVALSDGAISTSERQLLIARTKEFGFEEKLLEELLAKHKEQIAATSSMELIEEYTENKSDYLNGKIYDWPRFMLKIKDINFEDPHLRKYRDDLLNMVSHNAEHFQEIARSWEELYRTSNVQSDWEEYREHMEKCLELAKYLRGLHEKFLCASKSEFIKLCVQLSTPSDDSW